MGLIQRVIEQSGIATVGITIVRAYTEKVKPPRSLFLQWPFGHPLGEAFNERQQTAVVRSALDLLYTTNQPGTIIDSTFKWRRTTYPPAPWETGTTVRAA